MIVYREVVLPARNYWYLPAIPLPILFYRVGILVTVITGAQKWCVAVPDLKE